MHTFINDFEDIDINELDMYMYNKTMTLLKSGNTIDDNIFLLQRMIKSTDNEIINKSLFADDLEINKLKKRLLLLKNDLHHTLKY